MEEPCAACVAVLAPTQVTVTDLREDRRAGLPRCPLPALRLARFAVDAQARGLGVRSRLVRATLGLALALRERVGC